MFDPLVCYYLQEADLDDGGMNSDTPPPISNRQNTTGKLKSNIILIFDIKEKE